MGAADLSFLTPMPVASLSMLTPPPTVRADGASNAALTVCTPTVEEMLACLEIMGGLEDQIAE